MPALRVRTGTQIAGIRRLSLLAMAMAMLIIGVLFGLSLIVTVALFGILGMDGHFRDNFSAVVGELRRRVTGRPRPGGNRTTDRRVETDARLRSVQEELRVTQRLMEQARVSHEADAESMRKAAEEIAALRGSLVDQGARIAGLEAASSAEAAKLERIQNELADRNAQLAGYKREIRDLEIELGVARSGAALLGK